MSDWDDKPVSYDSYHLVIYPGGDRSKLSVAELPSGIYYEKDDYALASRNDFYNDRPGAVAHAKALAAEHGLNYVGSREDGHDFLD
jgi:hypothetical protein